MRHRDALRLLPALLLAVACDEPTKKGAAPSAAPSPSAIPATTPPTARIAPADVDLTSSLKDLKCGDKATTDSCRILTEFRDAKSWNFNLPSGEGRWVGNAFVREKGSEKKQLLILWAKRMPTAQVGPGDLPLKVGTGTLPSELLEHGFKMVRTLSQGDQPSKRNQARPVIESFVPGTQRGAVATQGASVRLISEEAVYIRQQGRKVLFFSPNLSQGASSGDGTYAEFWLSNW
ncbi:MAG: hypothetical protein QM784_03335 [Polyangiaceae bacterium]